MTDDLETVAKEAAEEGRKTFDLGARLKGRGLRRVTHRAFTDEEAGQALGGVEERRDPSGSFVIGHRKWGAIGELTDLKLAKEKGDDNDLQIDAKTEEIRSLMETLDATALDIELQAIPPVVKKDARRKAKAALDIKGKGVPDDRLDEFADEFNAQLLHAAALSITDVGTGDRNTSVSVEDARNLYDFLPSEESARLEEAVAKLLFESAIADHATSDVDFSQRT